jgi:hypothetical protein
MDRCCGYHDGSVAVSAMALVAACNQVAVQSWSKDGGHPLCLPAGEEAALAAHGGW